MIRGTRILVRNILGLFAGYTIPQILGTYPELTTEDIVAALEFATEFVDETRVITG